MSGPTARPVVLVVVGPTAAGKSAFALRACGMFGGEILSVDSMQVYRGLDAATSKPGPADRARVPHHGLDLASARDDFSMGDYVRAAEKAVEDMLRRSRLPVIVGGTGLYLRGLLRGVVDAPRRSPGLRRRLNATADRRGAGWLHRMLRRVDAATAERLGARDRQRVVRALEVYFSVGRRLSDLIGEAPFGDERYDAVKIGLSMDRETLYRRIEARADGFFASGLVDEVHGLLREGCPESANALRGLGYKETLAHLRGEFTLEEAMALTRRNTRRYAKRQWTWFRKEPGVTWFDIDPSSAEPFERPLRHAALALAAKGVVAWA